MRLSTTTPPERGTRLRVATYASHISQSHRSVSFPVLTLVSLRPPHACEYSNRDAQHGRSIHGMISHSQRQDALPFQSRLTTNHPGLRNPRLSKEPLFRRRPHPSPFPVHLSSVDCQKTYSADRETVCRHWRWFSYSTLDGNSGERHGSVTRRAASSNGAPQKLRRIPLCASLGR
jgi:hypothetical protein